MGYNEKQGSLKKEEEMQTLLIYKKIKGTAAFIIMQRR